MEAVGSAAVLAAAFAACGRGGRTVAVGLPHPSAELRMPALPLVAEGKTDWEISVILGIAEATVRFHVDNARRKLGAVNRAQAVARLVNQRLI